MDQHRVIVPARAGDEIAPGTVQLIGQKNSSVEIVLDNIQENIRRQLPQLSSFGRQETRVAIAAGGPSLKTNLKTLRRQVDRGFKLVTVNGTHDYLLDKGFTPSLFMMVDARQWNVRFVQRPVKSCTYFISSQCHPDVFEALRDHDKVYIFHIDIGKKTSAALKMLNDYYFKRYITVIGGTTVIVNSLVLLHHLGFRYYNIFGFDSCFLNGEHHSYNQMENTEQSYKVIAKWAKKDRIFYCASWHIRQMYDFQQLIRVIPEDYFKCRVHGAGLISYMMRTGCEIDVTKTKE